MPKRSNSQNEVNPSHPSSPPASRATEVRAVLHTTIKGSHAAAGDQAPRSRGTPGLPGRCAGPAPVLPRCTQRCERGTAPARGPRADGLCVGSRTVQTGRGEAEFIAFSCPEWLSGHWLFTALPFQEACGNPLEMRVSEKAEARPSAPNLVSSVGSEWNWGSKSLALTLSRPHGGQNTCRIYNQSQLYHLRAV